MPPKRLSLCYSRDSTVYSCSLTFSSPFLCKVRLRRILDASLFILGFRFRKPIFMISDPDALDLMEEYLWGNCFGVFVDFVSEPAWAATCSFWKRVMGWKLLRQPHLSKASPLRSYHSDYTQWLMQSANLERPSAHHPRTHPSCTAYLSSPSAAVWKVTGWLSLRPKVAAVGASLFTAKASPLGHFAQSLWFPWARASFTSACSMRSRAAYIPAAVAWRYADSRQPAETISSEWRLKMIFWVSKEDGCSGSLPRIFPGKRHLKVACSFCLSCWTLNAVAAFFLRQSLAWPCRATLKGT